MITAGVAALNILLGVVYTSYGIMTLIEMKREWKTMGYSHFGAAWVAMAFTCGPHHLSHGLHVALSGRVGGGLDFAYVLVGLPAGAIWFLLRVEAFTGGRGDRFISGTPLWVGLLPTIAGFYGSAFVASAIHVVPASTFRLTSMVMPNVLLVGIYMTIGYFLFRTQVRNHGSTGGWSVSGLSLGLVFPTCAIMHATWVLYAMNGNYRFDPQTFVIDWLAVPAALYFLWVVRGLYRDALLDWNRTTARPAILVG
jgi:hypothetical protein